jgi:large subunit ribosomal protein L24
MHIKSGDNVIVISGKDKGVTGKVLKAFPREDRVIVEGVNIKKRHKKPTSQGKKGQIVETAYPMHVSNLKKADEQKTEQKSEKPKAAKKAPAKAKKTEDK